MKCIKCGLEMDQIDEVETLDTLICYECYIKSVEVERRNNIRNDMKSDLDRLEREYLDLFGEDRFEINLLDSIEYMRKNPNVTFRILTEKIYGVTYDEMLENGIEWTKVIVRDHKINQVLDK